MPQILLTEDNFINESVLEIKFSESISTKFKAYRVGLCYINAVFKSGGVDKIIITSHSVTSIQHIDQWSVIGTCFNTNKNNQHFIHEVKNPQIYGNLTSRNKFDVRLFREDFQPIRREDLQHLGICITLLGVK